MYEIYASIISRLATEVTELAYVAADNGQLDNGPDPMGNFPVQLPCALVEITGIDWTTTDNPVQTGSGEVVVHFAWRLPTRFDAFTKTTKSLESKRWLTATKISKFLHGYSDTDFGPLERTRVEREKIDGGIEILHIAFAFDCNENLAL